MSILWLVAYYMFVFMIDRQICYIYLNKILKTGKTILVKYAYVFEKLFIKDEGMVNAEGVLK